MLQLIWIVFVAMLLTEEGLDLRAIVDDVKQIA